MPIVSVKKRALDARLAPKRYGTDKTGAVNDLIYFR
jgi:hypothetical protein